MTEDYIPTRDDVLWIQTMIARARDGGILPFPLTDLAYQVDKASRVLTLINPEILSDCWAKVCHQRTIKVCAKIGYMVLVQEKDQGRGDHGKNS